MGSCPSSLVPTRLLDGSTVLAAMEVVEMAAEAEVALPPPPYFLLIRLRWVYLLPHSLHSFSHI